MTTSAPQAVVCYCCFLCLHHHHHHSRRCCTSRGRPRTRPRPLPIASQGGTQVHAWSSGCSAHGAGAGAVPGHAACRGHRPGAPSPARQVTSSCGMTEWLICCVIASTAEQAASILKQMWHQEHAPSEAIRKPATATPEQAIRTALQAYVHAS